ncbi:MAG: tRNA lysidine(34) synthetase TilS [Spirochaetaceae bacterium]|jgi:tRNA(Ile)-lysidine synthase|nr:tRNA lysidine(34) synthetase TilS [Spirochaetaceae bacterium]
MTPGNFESAVAAALPACQAGTVYLAAVSGGADSTAMLAALVSLRDSLAFTLRCIHVEHGIRAAAESRGDAAFVRELCEKLNTSCKVVSIQPGKISGTAKRNGIGIEASARLYRRRALFREARRVEAETGAFVRILTAHTRDDLLETALMRILRGAGPAGLAAMPVCRGRFLRPLLALSRADVLRYLAETHIPWREDATNADPRFLRNRIRHRLVPLLNESFPQWRTGLAALSETQSLAAAFIGDEALRRIVWVTDGGALHTGAEFFFAQSAVIREEALFQGIDRLLAGRAIPVPVKRAALRRFCAGLVKAADMGPLRVRREGGEIILSMRKKQPSESGFALLIKGPGLYTLKRVFFEVALYSQAGSESTDGFCALPPVAVRRTYKGDCMVNSGGKMPPDGGTARRRERMWSAVDRLGIAAFIGPDGLMQRRAVPVHFREAERQALCVVKVQKSNNTTGGMNVQQSK